MESILRLTMRNGEVWNLVKPDRNDEEAWLQVYALIGNAQTIEVIPQE